MWAIWTSRNNITHDNGSIDPVQSLRRIREVLAILDLPRDHARTMPGFGWRPPGDGWVKVNTDAGVALDARKSGAGGVARTATSFIGAWSKPLVGVTDPLVAEALALREGVIFAKLRGFTQVVMEVDCLELVDHWTMRQGSRSLIAPVFIEIEELASSFTSFVIQHVKRHSNNSAHLCARFACTLERSDCWMSSPPSFLVTSIQADCEGAVFSE
jgi:ribonuclease HI